MIDKVLVSASKQEVIKMNNDADRPLSHYKIFGLHKRLYCTNSYNELPSEENQVQLPNPSQEEYARRLRAHNARNAQQQTNDSQTDQDTELTQSTPPQHTRITRSMTRNQATTGQQNNSSVQPPSMRRRGG